MSEPVCRACRGRNGQIVLDLGRQPASDHFPRLVEPGPDARHPLQMWLCAGCGLAQLLSDPTVPEEPRGAEPAALVAQARDAVHRVSRAGLLPQGARVAEYGSPHGGSWLGMLRERGLRPVAEGEADVILDCFGMMHCPDQAAALAERAGRLSEDGVLLVQYHSLATIIRCGQWNALRHGHYAYYSTTALVTMLAAAGLKARTAWTFDLYGGTVLLAASRTAEPDDIVRALLGEEQAMRITEPNRLRVLQDEAAATADALRRYLTEQRQAGRRVYGYGAASRAVALLCRAGIDSVLLPAIADAAPAKQKRRMPGSGVPVISPAELVAAEPDEVLLFLPDLATEARTALPQIEANGGRWVIAEPRPDPLAPLSIA
ncbi:class I SAM-dependent methyltransferase [Allokutzneria albata]|uniref:Putative zinc binding domain-containing protein n=1 Tax=Allokutzneria albata TaxID=211114 RepID=A0A1H0CF50_ALLAB|nr:class I SAM-dependent methyltransferase [Allokutzneria albata]SDN56534.1 Putative zinc binding domain-containing protein [Allokutzneria albata]